MDGTSSRDALRVNFDRKLKIEFRGVKVTSDAGLLAYREIDDVFGLTDVAAYELTDNRTGRNTQYGITALLPQSVYSRLAGYEDTNDAKRLFVDPAMRHVVGERTELCFVNVSMGNVSLKMKGSVSYAWKSGNPERNIKTAAGAGDSRI